MKSKVITYILALGTCSALMSMEPEAYEFVSLYDQKRDATQWKDTAKNLFGGSATGAIEVMVDQPLIRVKNDFQQGKKLSLKPHELYKGSGVNVACMVPTTGVQIMANKALENVLPGDDTLSKTERAMAAGALAAPLASVTETVVIHQQNTGKNALDTIDYLIKNAGKGVLGRGMLATALRDSGFTVGYLTAYPLLEKNIRKHIDNPAIATALGGVTAGVGTAIVTHPFDTIKTHMQVDYKKAKARTMWQTIKTIYQKDGYKGLFKGVVPRGTRVAMAIPLMSKVQEYLTNKMDNPTKTAGS